MQIQDLSKYVKTGHIVQTVREIYERQYLNNQQSAISIAMIGYFQITSSFDYDGFNYVSMKNWEYDFLKDESKFTGIPVGTATEKSWGLPGYIVNETTSSFEGAIIPDVDDDVSISQRLALLESASSAG